MAPILTGNPYAIHCLLAKSFEELKGKKKPKTTHGEAGTRAFGRDRQAAWPSRQRLPLNCLCLSFPTTLQHADPQQPLQGELPAMDPSHGVSLEWGDVQPRAEHPPAAGQVSPGLPGRRLGTSPSCKPLSPCSRQVGKGVVFFFFPIPGLPRRLQCPWYSWSGAAGLRQAGVCFPGWAGGTGCLHKVFGGDRGREASDLLAPPQEHTPPCPRRSFGPCPTGSGYSERPRCRAGAQANLPGKPLNPTQPWAKPVSHD